MVQNRLKRDSLVCGRADVDPHGYAPGLELVG